jgi:hypothetical protein
MCDSRGISDMCALRAVRDVKRGFKYSAFVCASHSRIITVHTVDKNANLNYMLLHAKTTQSRGEVDAFIRSRVNYCFLLGRFKVTNALL